MIFCFSGGVRNQRKEGFLGRRGHVGGEWDGGGQRAAVQSGTLWDG